MTSDRYAGDVLRGPAPGRVDPVVVPARPGMLVEVLGDAFAGAVVRVDHHEVVLRDRRGRERSFVLRPGRFVVDDRVSTLVRPSTEDTSSGPALTRSGSVAVQGEARVARASRIWVEGIHDAELLEHVWGDDLRWVGVVVEPIGGIDDLAARVRAFRPGAQRRLGVLVDHLRPGTKEARLVAEVRDPHVLVRGHRFVDVWAALDPGLAGLDAWPDVPHGTDWKAGVMAAAGASGEPGTFWRGLLRRVGGLRDLDRGLVRAVEELIDHAGHDPAADDRAG